MIPVLFPNPRSVALLLALLVASSTGCKREKPEAPAGTLTVSVEQQAAWIRNFNPLVAAGGARWPTAGGVYEPLLVFNSIQGEYIPGWQRDIGGSTGIQPWR